MICRSADHADSVKKVFVFLGLGGKVLKVLICNIRNNVFLRYFFSLFFSFVSLSAVAENEDSATQISTVLKDAGMVAPSPESLRRSLKLQQSDRYCKAALKTNRISYYKRYKFLNQVIGDNFTAKQFNDAIAGPKGLCSFDYYTEWSTNAFNRRKGYPEPESLVGDCMFNQKDWAVYNESAAHNAVLGEMCAALVITRNFGAVKKIHAGKLAADEALAAKREADKKMAEAEKERLRQIAEAKRLEKERKEKERLLAARVKKEKEEALRKKIQQSNELRQKLFAESVPSEKDRLVWSSEYERAVSASGSFFEPNWEIFAVIHENERRIFNLDGNKSAKFKAPKKGEFEKSSDYTERVEKERESYERKVKQEVDDLTGNREEVLAGVMTHLIGAPEIKGLKYDADKEEFSFSVNAVLKDFSLSAKLPMPLGKAEKFKKVATSASRWILFSTQNNKVKVKKILLQVNGETYEAQLVGPEVVAEQYGIEAITKMNENSDKRFQALSIKEAKLKAEEVKRRPYEGEFNCSFSGSYVPVYHCLAENGRIQILESGVQRQIAPNDVGSSASYKIYLPERFVVSSINGFENKKFTLSLKIIRRDNGVQVFEGSATGAFEKISVKN